MTALLTTGEHPFHVLQRLRNWQAEGRECALVIITKTEGGAVRAPGALLAVSRDASLGYISGGCIDADVILQARQAIDAGAPKAIRYGSGSPFVDLPLPCGGAIEVVICPAPDVDLIAHAAQSLADRRGVTVYLSSDGQLARTVKELDHPLGARRFDYDPPLRLRIAGRGADALALATISNAAGYETRLQLVDDDDIHDARQLGLTKIEQLTTVASLPPSNDDAWTAFVLLFHDRDLEIPLLKQALDGPAFYIGAVGSRRTQDVRCEELRSIGIQEDQIARVHGPIGVVPSLRDASAIALSTLAEIVEAAKNLPAQRETRTAFILLAAGASTRFESGDKLLAQLNGKPILEHAGSVLNFFSPSAAIAIVPDTDNERTDVLLSAGWSVVVNPHAADGQASSIRCALKALEGRDDVDQIIILLGDMPNIPHSHIDEILTHAEHPSIDAIMSISNEVLLPPALFKHKLFSMLAQSKGDEGAKSMFLHLDGGTSTLPLSSDAAIDIDRVADLARVKEIENA